MPYGLPDSPGCARSNNNNNNYPNYGSFGNPSYNPNFNPNYTPNNNYNNFNNFNNYNSGGGAMPGMPPPPGMMGRMGMNAGMPAGMNGVNNGAYGMNMNAMNMNPMGAGTCGAGMGVNNMGMYGGMNGAPTGMNGAYGGGRTGMPGNATGYSGYGMLGGLPGATLPQVPQVPQVAQAQAQGNFQPCGSSSAAMPPANYYSGLEQAQAQAAAGENEVTSGEGEGDGDGGIGIPEIPDTSQMYVLDAEDSKVRYLAMTNGKLALGDQQQLWVISEPDEKGQVTMQIGELYLSSNGLREEPEMLTLRTVKSADGEAMSEIVAGDGRVLQKRNLEFGTRDPSLKIGLGLPGACAMCPEKGALQKRKTCVIL